jgi:hypothetical protein
VSEPGTKTGTTYDAFFPRLRYPNLQSMVGRERCSASETCAAKPLGNLVDRGRS